MNDIQSMIVDGVRLECRWFGRERNPGRPVLVLLHEGLGCLEMWRGFPDALAQATGCPVFAYSRAGYGASDPVTLPRPIDYMQRHGLNVLPKVLETLGDGSFFLVGHSDGASIAAVYAGAFDDPRLRGLVLMAPHFFVEDITHASIAAAKVAFEEGDLRNRLARYHGDNVDVAFHGWNRAWLDNDFQDWNIEDYAEKVTVPVTVLQGVDDQYGTIAQVDCAAARMKGPVETHLMADCGHSPHREQGPRTVELTAGFVTRNGGFSGE